MHVRQLMGSAISISLAAFVASGCTAFGGIPSNAICMVGGESITKADYTRIEDEAAKSLATSGKKLPAKNSDGYAQLRSKAVDALIQQKLLAREARKLGVKVSSKEIDKRLAKLIQPMFKGSRDAYEKALKAQGVTVSEVREFVRQQLLSEKLTVAVTRTIKVSDADARKYFNENKGKYTRPEGRDVAHILVKDKQKADEIYAQVKSGNEKTFAELARKFSQDPGSAQNGGTLTIFQGQTAPEFDKKAFELKTGEISTPVKTMFGYHIITARSAIKPGAKANFDKVRNQIKQQLRGEQSSGFYADWITNMRADAESDVRCRKSYAWTQTVNAPLTSTTLPGNIPSVTKSSTTVKG